MTGNDTAIYDVIYLCGCAVNGITPEAERISKMDLAALYREADRHMLTAVVAYALEMAGVHDAAFEQARMKSIRKTAIMDDEQSKVLARLEEAGIWYMPLKGAVLKNLYPAYGIRQMSDRDILIDAERAEEVREIMESLGFEASEYGKGNHDCYIKRPVSNFEMHRSLFNAMQKDALIKYYADVKVRLVKDKDNYYGWQFSPEDFYVFMIAHEYKHYFGRGTGLRSLLDTYVYLNNVKLNKDYVVTETEKLGIAEFEKANRDLAKRLFCGNNQIDINEKMLEYVVSSGVYGTFKNSVNNQLTDKGRMGYFLSRLTLPYPVMLEHYPVLNKAPVLYPLCWIHRLLYGFFFKNKKFMHQLKAGLTWKEPTKESEHER